MNRPMWTGSSKRQRGKAARRAERHKTNLLTCDLGKVIDVSATGMQIRCDAKPPLKVGQVFQAKLASESQRVTVSGQVVWLKRCGLKSFAIGVQFLNMKKGTAAVIESLGRFGFVDLDAVAAKKAEQTKQSIRATIQLPDYYQVLGVPRHASAEQIQQAFRDLARKYHPDVADVQGASRKFVEINEAYTVLSDSHQRRVYDLRMAG